MVISEGRLEKSICKEVHHFQPFSNGVNGATTTMSVLMMFLNKEIKNPLEFIGHNLNVEKSNLLFIHDHQRADGSADEYHVKQLLKTAETIEESKIPTLFNNLVYSLRNLKHSNLIKIYHDIAHDRSNALFMDALPLLRTDAGVSLMRDIIVSGELPFKTIDSWLFSLTFYKNPTRAMIGILSTLVDSKSRHSALLGISALIKTFCQSAENCYELAEIRDIVVKYENQLGLSCETNSFEDEERLTVVLKSIRNIGFVINKNVLKQCYQGKYNSMWLRLAALDTIKSFPCQFAHQDYGLIRMFQDKQEDSELRIGAYLALVHCPSEATLKNIKALMIDEPINQIGSFVWTHLTNLQESKSKDEWKMQLKSIVGNEFIRNKWKTDVRKFSRNIEMSYYSKDLRIGGTLDSNIIFSEKSYIPRSASVNLTTSLFGENINFLEIGGRIEGFEDVVENFFGPEGYFREDNFHKLLQSLRSKRDVQKDSLKNFQKEFGPEARVEEPRGNLYLRLFGIDIYYNSFKGISSLFNNMLMKPLDYLGFSFGENEFEFQKSSIFLDGSIIVPTAMGIPLNLTVNGTSHVNLKSKTKLKFGELFSTGKTHLKAQMYPTVSLKISALMSVDAFFAQTGLKSISKLHTAAYFDASADIQNGKLIKFNVNMPSDKIDLIEGSAEFFTYKRGKFQHLKPMHNRELLEKCSSEKISDIFGFKICCKGNYYPGNADTSPDWYFTGPSFATLHLEKIDSLEKIYFEYSWSRDDSNPMKGVIDDIRLSLDTPGSSIKRGFSWHLKFDDIKTFFLLKIDFPVWKSGVELRYDWSVAKKVLKGFLVIAGFDIIGLEYQTEKQEQKYEAKYRLKYWGEEILDWQGIFHTAPNKHSIDAKLKGNFHEPINIAVDFIISDNNMHISGNVTSNIVKLNFNGKCQQSETTIKTTGIIAYDVANKYSGTLDLSIKVQMVQQGMLKKNSFIILCKVIFQISLHFNNNNKSCSQFIGKGYE